VDWLPFDAIMCQRLGRYGPALRRRFPIRPEACAFGRRIPPVSHNQRVFQGSGPWALGHRHAHIFSWAQGAQRTSFQPGPDDCGGRWYERAFFDTTHSPGSIRRPRISIPWRRQGSKAAIGNGGGTSFWEPGTETQVAVEPSTAGRRCPVRSS